MAKISGSNFLLPQFSTGVALLSAASIFLFSGCGGHEDEFESIEFRPQQPLTNAASSSAKSATVVLTEDQQAALKMRDSLDGGDFQDALFRARKLMTSREPDVRQDVVQVLGWVGKRTLPELTAMLADADEAVATDALNEWEKAFDELRYDFEREKWMLKALGGLRDRAAIDAILMKTSGMEECSALGLLDKIITTLKGSAASTCAKDMFAHLSGEYWDSPERTKRLIEKIKNDNGLPKGSK